MGSRSCYLQACVHLRRKPFMGELSSKQAWSCPWTPSPSSDVHAAECQTSDMAKFGREVRRVEWCLLPLRAGDRQPRDQGAGRVDGGDDVWTLTLPVTWSGAMVGGRLEAKPGLRASVPWGKGQSLWALVNRSGNKTRRTQKNAVLCLRSLFRPAPRWA